MKKPIVSIIALSFIMLANPVFAQIAPKSGFPQDRYKEFKVDSNVQYGTLKNGMRYAIQKWPTPKGEISIRMRIAAGSLNEAENQKGLMHFLEHMAFNGSENIKENEMIPLLEKEGLAFGADTNAHTSFDETVYKLDMPKPEQLDLGLKLMRETAGRLTLASDAIDRERGIIKSEERARMNPGYTQWIDYANTIFDGFLFPKRLPIGDMNVIGNAPQKEFKSLYNGLYQPQRTMLVIAGDIDAKKAKAAIEKHFNNWQAINPAQKDPSLGKLVKRAPKYRNYVDKQLPSSISVASLSPYIQEADTSANRRKEIIAWLAESIVNERLQKIVRAEDAPFASASIRSYDMIKSAKIAELSISPKAEGDWEKALSAADVELRSALQYGFTPEEFKTALLNAKNYFEKKAKEDGARRSRQISESILSSFENDSVHTSNADDLLWFNKISKTLNANEAHNALKEKWKNPIKDLYIVTQNPIAGGEDTLKSKYAQIQQIATKPPIVEKIKIWDYVDFGVPQQPLKVVENAQIGANFYTFPNNVRLIVKPTDYEEGRARLSVVFGDGAIAQNQIGLNLVTNSILEAGGFGRLSIDDLKKTLAGKNVNTGFSTSDNFYELSGVTDNANIALQLQIMAAYFTDPAYRKDGFVQLMAQKDAIYKDARATPDIVFWREIGGILSNNVPYNMFPTQSQFEALKFDDAKNAINLSLANSAIEIVIVGDVETKKAIDAVAKTFGALPNRQALPNNFDNYPKPVFPNGRKETNLSHDGKDYQAIGAIIYPTSDFGDGAMGRKLNILRDMLNVKLTDIIREKEGGTYSPQVISDSSIIFKNYGYMGVVLNVKPQEVDKYLAISESIIKDFADGKINEDLLKRAKAPAIASIKTTMKNNPWWLGWLKGASFDENKITIIRDGEKQYQDITLDDVKKLAKQYFDPQKAQIIRVLPSDAAKN
jgi:zinc protease